MKKSSIICGAALAIFSFSSCIENTPSAGVEAIRNGYANQLNAEAESEKIKGIAEAGLIDAKAAYKAAETALKQAEADLKQTEVKYKEIQNQKEELTIAQKEAEVALEILKKENESKEEMARVELALAQKRYDFDTKYAEFKRDSLNKLSLVEAAMAQLAEDRVQYQIKLDQAQRDAEDAVFELANTLTAKQQAEANALANKWIDYANVFGQLTAAKGDLADTQYELARYENIKNKMGSKVTSWDPYGNSTKSFGITSKDEALEDLQDRVDDAQEELDDAIAEKTEHEEYLAYLKAFPTEADAYTQELISLETELEQISGEYGVYRLEKESAEDAFDIKKAAAQELQKEELDAKYDKVVELEEAKEEAYTAKVAAENALANFVNVGTDEIENNIYYTHRDVEVYTYIDGEFQWKPWKYVLAQNPGDIRTNYLNLYYSKERLDYEISSTARNDQFIKYWKEFHTTAMDSDDPKIKWMEDFAENVVSYFPKRTDLYNAVIYPKAGDAADKKQAEKDMRSNLETGLTEQIAALVPGNDESLQIKKEQLQKDLENWQKSLVELQDCVNDYYETWKALDQAYIAANDAFDVADKAFESAKDIFDEECSEAFEPYVYYHNYDDRWTNGDRAYTASDLVYDEFVFAKQEEMDVKYASFSQKKERYEALQSFINGNYELAKSLTQPSEYAMNDKTLNFQRINIETIEYEYMGTLPYNTLRLNNEIERIEDELEATGSYSLNGIIESAEETLATAKENLADLESDVATAKDYVKAIIEILTLREKKEDKIVTRYQGELDLLVTQIDALTLEVDKQSATATNPQN